MGTFRHLGVSLALAFAALAFSSPAGAQNQPAVSSADLSAARDHRGEHPRPDHDPSHDRSHARRGRRTVARGSERRGDVPPREDAPRRQRDARGIHLGPRSARDASRPRTRACARRARGVEPRQPHRDRARGHAVRRAAAGPAQFGNGHRRAAFRGDDARRLLGGVARRDSGRVAGSRLRQLGPGGGPASIGAAA